ncbi:MAG TPA: tRNA pseudouridine(55) synthase TruB [Candidatus Marinimicrobia bacterium]|jgi:tRNA pseudouridine55 synthase|nr:tRNA pseudouridine(55) synthase TruB [Candidatus Neomarinimicrobiota bacterium]HIL86012.1 tRNA pseudouridine(55) synthase TruB [Candidatus Neomarinimicrobiota bacterium]
MIYNIYKPKDFSSFSVVKQVKRITHEKVGHSGTLDPFADGVLVLGIGKSTKKLSDIIQYDKTYEGVIKLGEKTDTKDLTGTVIGKEEVPNIDDIDFKKLSQSFLGIQMQETPMYSARKVNGVRLYKLARKNISVKRNPKQIEIKYLKCAVIDSDTLQIKVECSSGTYIRVLAEDIAKKIGTIGHLIKLTRTTVGSFSLNDSLTVEKFEEEWKS